MKKDKHIKDENWLSQETNQCYICGRTQDKFHQFWKLDSFLQTRIESHTEKENELDKKLIDAVKPIAIEYLPKLKDLQLLLNDLPPVLDNFGLQLQQSEIQTLRKINPSISNFVPNLRQIDNMAYSLAPRSNIGAMRIFVSNAIKSLEQHQIERTILQAFMRRFQESDNYRDPKYELLSKAMQLLGNREYEGLDRHIHYEFSQETIPILLKEGKRDRKTITLEFFLCPICRRMTKKNLTF
ncbi:hypothetical protein [Candidatus Lokiarchaeum ossiferum]|uniref:hypothetical protein n=1 Tax=Candidatus Lokiarchaeum ossiferum TaxID=2951803 RepID=UPI00352FC609